MVNENAMRVRMRKVRATLTMALTAAFTDAHSVSFLVLISTDNSMLLGGRASRSRVENKDGSFDQAASSPPPPPRTPVGSHL